MPERFRGRAAKGTIATLRQRQLPGLMRTVAPRVLQNSESYDVVGTCHGMSNMQVSEYQPTCHGISLHHTGWTYHN